MALGKPVGSRFTNESPIVTRSAPNPPHYQFSQDEFASFRDIPGGLGPTRPNRTRGPAQHQCPILDRHFHPRLCVQTQLRKWRFRDYDSLGAPDLSNLHAHSPHGNRNVVLCIPVCQSTIGFIQLQCRLASQREGKVPTCTTCWGWMLTSAARHSGRAGSRS
jgi:hypothetical protein